MNRIPQTLPDDDATIKVTHHAILRERAEMLRRRPGPKSARPECAILEHAWTEDPAREGGLICLTCLVVRRP